MVLNEWKYFYLKNIPFLSWAVSGYWKGDWWGSFRAVNAAALRLRLEEEEDKKHQNLKWKMTCAIIPPKCAHFRAVNAAALRLELEEEKDKSPQTGLEIFLHKKFPSKCAINPPKCTHFRAVNAAALRLGLREGEDKEQMGRCHVTNAVSNCVNCQCCSTATQGRVVISWRGKTSYDLQMTVILGMDEYTATLFEPQIQSIIMKGKNFVRIADPASCKVGLREALL